jgi:hypothetical protein
LARIVVVRHRDEEERFSTYLLHPLLRIWESRGHEIRVVRGFENLPDADLAILHVDLSVVPDEYREAVQRYPRVVNGRVLDVRKRRVSTNLLLADDDWDGTVIVKSNLNALGVPEYRVHANARPEFRYTIHARISDVPDQVWADPDLVVERFLPERDKEYFYLRVFTFCGDGTRNRICRSRKPIIRGASIIEHFPGPEVPEEILAERERLGFDFGKFDYVVREGKPILLDANKTPSFPPGAPQEMFDDLAAGLQTLLTAPVA